MGTMKSVTTAPAQRLRGSGNDGGGPAMSWLKRALPFIGPAFIVSIGYMDPGNWATDLAGGSLFGYRLIWVLLLSNLMAIFLQVLSAKLGLATGKDLAEHCREGYSRGTSLFLFVTAEAAMIATDLAEFIGSALGIHLLFHIPLFWAALVTGVDVLIILAMQRFGFRVLEIVLTALVATVGFSYVAEIILSNPDWAGVAAGTFIPQLTPASALIAIGMLGATVMPHNLYLHSSLIKSRRKAGDDAHNAEALRFTKLDATIALNGAFFVNAAILVMAAAVFYSRGLEVVTIEQAHQTLTPLLGPAAATIFAVALLAAGVSSSTTGTLAGQVVMEGFLKTTWSTTSVRLFTRLFTMVPALICIWLGVNSVMLLVWSQVLLSIQLPFAIIPLVKFTKNKGLMGRFTNTRLVNSVAYLIAAVVIGLNVYGLWSTFFG